MAGHGMNPVTIRPVIFKNIFQIISLGWIEILERTFRIRKEAERESLLHHQINDLLI